MAASLTFLIPTYNRPTRLQRCLYWLCHSTQDSALKFKILIADGSSLDVKKTNLKTISTSQLNIDYIPYNEEVYLLSRIKHGLARVDTKYVHILGDDDFALVDGIGLASKELESDKNDNFVCCSGQYLHLYDIPISGKLSACYFDISYQTSRARFCYSKSYLKRLIDHKTTYSIGCPSLSYSVYKTQVLADVLSSWSDDLLYTDSERMHQVAALSKGNILYLQTPSLIRDFGGYRTYIPEPCRQAPQTYFSANGLEKIRKYVATNLEKELGSAELANKYANILDSIDGTHDSSISENPSLFDMQPWNNIFYHEQVKAFYSKDYDFFWQKLQIPARLMQILCNTYEFYYQRHCAYLAQKITQSKSSQEKGILSKELQYITRSSN